MAHYHVIVRVQSIQNSVGKSGEPQCSVVKYSSGQYNKVQLIVVKNSAEKGKREKRSW